MDIREIVRGTVDWDDLEGIADELAHRLDRDSVRLEFLEADNWLSTPLVVDDEWFVKIITPQNAIVHAVFTGARNLGAFSSGTPGFFNRFAGPVEMGQHELEATQRIREIGLNAPRPIQAFEYEGYGVVVLEYLPEFRTLEDLSDEELRTYADDLFEALKTMHDHGLAHGDLRGENVLVSRGELYFIDATAVDEEAINEARGYDIGCALAVLAPRIGVKAAVRIAADIYPPEDLLSAKEFVDFISVRPDLDVDAEHVKEELENRAENG